MAVPVLLPAGHVVLASELQGIIDEINTRILKPRGDRQTNSSTTTTEVGVLRLDGIPVTLGRQYVIETGPLVLASTVANDVLRAILRVNTAGTATTSSTQIGMAQATVPNTTFPGPGQIVRGIYIPAATGTLSVLLSISRQSGTGNAQILGASTFPLGLWIEDKGLDATDTGVDI